MVKLVRLFDQFPLELKQEVVEYRRSNKSNSPEHKTRSGKNSNNNSKLKKKKDELKVEFAFPKSKKLPLSSERQVKSAINDLDKVKGHTDEETLQAYKKIINAANRYSICTMVLDSKFEHCLNPDSKELKKN
ncbi:MAG: hypothetical protein DRQ39_07130 [Gammaproteobacteria bacterium]|nr:MAG: hypothetical protein DRQ39_07130 [Gammaproteobacteria bacterium]